ncbi:MAG: family 78 glycoside hydrolase catalytic domain, partial [Lentisphaeria bacterium]
GVFVVDTGTVMAGWVRLIIPQGKRGETVTLRYAELLHEDGMVDTSTANRARQQDAYTMKGTADETYEPRFTYHGFRYVEITGFPGQPEVDNFAACLVHNSVRPVGTFECAHELINKIHSCTVQSQRCNFQMGVPTDDTQRPERQGWGGDAWSYAQEAFFNFNVPSLFSKWIADFYDQQDDSGMVGMITPQAGPEEDLVWSAAFVLIPWWLYLHYGERRILADSYPYLQHYTAYLEATGRRDVISMTPEEVTKALFWRCDKDERLPVEEKHGYLQIARWGDHLATNEGSSGFAGNQPVSIATAFYYYDVTIMVRIAETLGKVDDAREYRALAGKIKEAFNTRFFDAASGYYDIGCQSAQAWPLAFGLVPDEHKDRVSGYLNSSVNFRQRRITSGYAGTKWLIEAISESGRNDIIWNRAVATDYPSWGYMLQGDKTTITENWHGGASQCHTTLGAAIDEWFYWGLAGIRADASAPGFKHIIFKPYLPPDLPWVQASLQTPRGEIVSSWKHDGSTGVLTINTPANSTATVHLPVKNAERVSESGVPAVDADGVALIDSAAGNCVFAVGSGTYCFKFALTTSDG